MIRLLNIFHLRLAMPRRFKPWHVLALLWMTGLSVGATESTPPSLDQPTTATLARQLDTLDQIRLHYSALRYYSVADDDAGGHFDRLRTLAASILPPRGSANLPIGSFDSAPDTGEAREAAGEAILADCALALMTRLTTPPLLLDLSRQAPPPSSTAAFYHSAGLTLAAVFDTLTDSAHRQRLLDTAPGTLRARLIVLDKLHELYRTDYSPTPRVGDSQPGGGAFPALEKAEPHGQSLARRIMAFQSVLPAELLAGGASPRAADFDPARWGSIRQWGQLAHAERRAIAQGWNFSDPAGRELWRLYVESAPGVAAWRRLADWAARAEREGDASVIAAIAWWEALTERRDFAGHLRLDLRQDNEWKLTWAPEAGRGFALRLLDQAPFIVFDHAALLPPIADSNLEQAYGAFLALVFNPDDRAMPPVFLSDPPDPAQEEWSLTARLHLASWMEERIAPQLTKAGLSPDHPAWAAKRDMLAQPFAQALALAHGDQIKMALDQKALRQGSALAPDDFNGWLANQLMKDFEASQKYQAEVMEWEQVFGDRRDAALSAAPAKEMWGKIFDLQAQLEEAIARAMAELLTPPLPAAAAR